MPNQGTQVHSFTYRPGGIIRQIAMPISISIPDNKELFNILGIWDTGATNSVITKKVADKLGMLPTGQVLTSTVSETDILVNTYTVDVYLSNNLRITSVPVTEGKITDDIDALIGMDIITLGDFSITNCNSNTCFSFRAPSQHEIDYVKATNGNQLKASDKPGRNDPCPCGSQRKYKHCCGK